MNPNFQRRRLGHREDTNLLILPMNTQLASGEAGILLPELHSTSRAGEPLTLQPVGDFGE